MTGGKTVLPRYPSPPTRLSGGPKRSVARSLNLAGFRRAP
jgi:hypothetical protein